MFFFPFFFFLLFVYLFYFIYFFIFVLINGSFHLNLRLQDGEYYNTLEVLFRMSLENMKGRDSTASRCPMYLREGPCD